MEPPRIEETGSADALRVCERVRTFKPSVRVAENDQVRRRM
jgi:hypothetical protein